MESTAQDLSSERKGSGHRNRQEDPLALLFAEHFDAVTRYVRRRSGHAVAQEIVSVTFFEAARQFKMGRGDSISLAWLLRVARCRLIDHWRSAERERKLIERVGVQIIDATPVPRSGPSDEIVEWLESLTPVQQRAILMRYVGGFSVGEIAEDLGRTYRGAEGVLARARETMRREALSSRNA